MTTAATVAGHLPLVLATGPGAGARNSIGIMLVSGMIIGTVFTLFVVPSIYVLVARKRAPQASMDRVANEDAPRLAPLRPWPVSQPALRESTHA
jgi:multidrug efflux pump